MCRFAVTLVTCAALGCGAGACSDSGTVVADGAAPGMDATLDVESPEAEADAAPDTTTPEPDAATADGSTDAAATDAVSDAIADATSDGSSFMDAAPTCVIGGVMWASGAINPANQCQSCQPGTSTTGWSTRANGASCGIDKVCQAGTCVPLCDGGDAGDGGC
jgi:hypothetical protein